jgi:Mg2+-importing ATPase
MERGERGAGNANPWVLAPDELYKEFSSSQRGLDESEAESRLKKYGFNEVERTKGRGAIRIFFSQFKNSLVILLIFAAIVSYFISEKIDSLVIISIIVINSFLGFFQEYKAERALIDLQKYVSSKSKVMRNGKIVEIYSKDIVPGDIVYLNAGDIIPADIRLIKINDFTANEASLTGESLPVIKNSEKLENNNSSVHELKNIALMGTSVVTGYGFGIIVATGSQTFFGKSAEFLKENPEGNFQKNLKQFSNFLLKATLVATFLIFIINAIFGKDITTSFLFALALAVGITPEALPIILTITLSRGALKMAKQKVVVKQLISIENLGNMDVLCCDKTGTLTEGNISLSDYYNVDNKKDKKMVLYGMLCNSARDRISNDIIDNSILKSIDAKALADKLQDFSVEDENEFDFERKRMAVLVKENRKNLIIVKGSHESILEVCKYALVGNRRVDLNKRNIDRINNIVLSYEEQGYKVISLAEKYTSLKTISKKDERDLTFVGFLLFLDSAKKDTTEALEMFNKLGVDLKVISGDSPAITRKICLDVGLKINKDRVITGEELESLSQQEFEKSVHEYNVFARVLPEQKYKIVSALSKEGKTVGFLGDGINDAPALKIADVGISVDSASDVAKDAADIILLNKSLKVIADGIVDGRKIFGNTTKYILNTMSANTGNMGTVALSSLFLSFIPLLPGQILLNNLASDIPCLAISSDNVDEAMLRRPKHWDLKFIRKFMIYFGILSSIFDITLILFLLFVFKAEVALFRTAWFLESILSEVIVLFAIRTGKSFFRSKPGTLLLISSILVGIFSIVLTYTAFGAEFFQFVKMPVAILLLIFVILIVYFISAEIFKRYFFKRLGQKI